jgi:HD-GYP domain-containing protein (c-di-GMP phosphodiesterase class II)
MTAQAFTEDRHESYWELCQQRNGELQRRRTGRSTRARRKRVSGSGRMYAAVKWRDDESHLPARPICAHPVGRCTLDNTLAVLAGGLEARETGARLHAHRVREYATELGRRMGLRPGEVATLRRAAFVHDVGKIGIADAVLLKQAALTPAETAQMRRHPEIGWRILWRLDDVEEIGDIVLSHHERCDGHGYPDGLKGTAIPLGARIMSVGDAFDAIPSGNAYRRAMPLRAALREIERCAGMQFDPDIVRCFHEVAPERWTRIRAHAGGGADQMWGAR